MVKTKDKRPDSDAIIFPLPDDKIGKPFASTVTDEEGKYEFKVKILRPGRYTIQVRYPGNEEHAPAEATTIVTVIPNVSNKKAIEEYNKVLRASIFSSTNIKEIRQHVEWSRIALEISSKKLKKHALKELEKTSKVASKRINQLRYRSHDRSSIGDIS